MGNGSRKSVRKLRKWCKPVVRPKGFLQHALRVFVVFLVFLPTKGLIDSALDNRYTKFAYLGEQAVSDLDYTDVYYQTHTDDYHFLEEKNVVVIDVSNVDIPNRRPQLLKLLKRLDSTATSVIGVNMFFRKTNAITDSLIRKYASEHHNVVFAVSDDADSVFVGKGDFKAKFGYANLPDTKFSSKRNYYRAHAFENDTIPSFAYAMAQKVQSRKNPDTASTFRLFYSCINNGYYDVEAGTGVPQEEQLKNFKSVSGTSFLKMKMRDVRDLVDRKAVIIGSLGRNTPDQLNDITDHYKTPTDELLINRMPIMPGAIVHANAYQQIDSYVFLKRMPHEELLKNVLLFLFLTLFYIFKFFLERISKVLAAIVVAIATVAVCLFMVALSVWLMKRNIYFSSTRCWLDILTLYIFFSLAQKGFEDIKDWQHRTKTNFP